VHFYLYKPFWEANRDTESGRIWVEFCTYLGGVEGRGEWRDCAAGFVGKLDPASLGIGERLMAKVVKAPAGDFRYWVDVREWARGIAVQLSEIPVS